MGWYLHYYQLKLLHHLGDIYLDLEKEFGKTFYQLDEVKATAQQKAILKKISPQQIKSTHLAGERIETLMTRAPGNEASIDGLKIITKGGWCTVRPSGTEEIYKIYAESFHDETHLQRILEEAQVIVNRALESEPTPENIPPRKST